MAKCPKCGATLKWYNFRAECKNCGVNIPNYNWENRLEEDADTAERSFAKLHYKLDNFKSGTIGNPMRIVRLVFTLLPLVALVVPLIKVQFSMPFYDKGESISFLTFILNYLTKMDIGGALKLISAQALGGTVKFLLLSVLMSFIAVIAGVLNFFVTLIAAIKLKAGLNVVLNVISTLTWSLSAVFLVMFTSSASQLTINMFSGTVLWGYIVGVVLFLANVVINIITSKDYKKQLKNQPSMEEAIANELKSLREAETETQMAY